MNREAVMTFHAVANWFRRQRERYELDRLGSAEFNRLARDMGVSPGDLDRLVAAAHDPQQLSAMLEALGIDEQELTRLDPALLRDMRRICGLCRAADECACELASGTAVHNYRNFCINTPTIDALRAYRHRSRS
jgi:uncharacterized protein YjiS (DUF1127 family)